MNSNTMIERMGDNAALSGLASTVQPVLREQLNARPALRDLLRGKWLGHALHPVLTDVTIGNYTAASLLDLTRRRDMETAADYLLALGILSAVGTAATGLADWSTTRGRGRSVGMVHALANTTALGLYVASLVMRRTGKRKQGVMLSYIAGGVVSAAAYLGGHLVFNDGIGVDKETMRENQPEAHEHVTGTSHLSYH